MDFKQINAFVWVAELGSFRAAAEKLHTTQPTISQRIAALESSMNVRLFERGARGIRLTEKGQELLSHARRMLELRNDMYRVARKRDAIRGTLRLGSSETLVHTWLHYLIDALHHRYPALTVDIQVDTTHVLRSQLASHQIDLAFVVGPSQDPRERHMHLCDYDLAWIASPGLKMHGRRVTVAELGHYPVITYPAVSLPYQSTKALLLEAGVKAPRLYGSASLSTIVHMTRRGIGPSVIAPAVITEEVEEGKLCLLDVDRTPAALGFYACWVDCPDSHTLRTVATLAQRIARRAGLPATLTEQP
ncbi:LysR family transcriptional regulator [Allopusillimonas soli]|uniref:LysR family transcriptional regulator n=1 Tax=Allopusillimonas soli TaxID=659016 RepID=A0A853FFB3_9BURK|nr:LysR family transcriptional regulator [Allopusillimonas soli]NYT37510.1 LysR family transcriptional regulator [Allopusillimonas soli]TEA74516.1 LysR family transcriptional regulator [Allopusillimonas soli]